MVVVNTVVILRVAAAARSFLLFVFESVDVFHHAPNAT